MFMNEPQIGAGGTGFHGRGAGSAAAQLKQLAALRVVLAAGGAANSVIALDITPDDHLISVINNNAGTLTDVTAATTFASAKAAGTVTFSGAGTAGDKITVAGLVYVLVASSAVTEEHDTHKVKIGGTAAATAYNLSSAINTREARRGAQVTAAEASGVVTVTAARHGTAGNALTLAETGAAIAVSGATLTGGSSTGLKVSSVTNQLQVFYFKNPA